MPNFDAAFEAVSRFISAGAAPCAVAAAGRREGDTATKAFGYLEPGGHAANTDTLIDVASLTKVTAVLPVLMKMIEMGEITLSMPVSRYIPGFAAPDKGHITLFDLTVHTSGLVWHTDFYNQGCGSADDAIPIICNMPLEYETGSKVEYSCLNYIILGKILEMTGGSGLDVLAKKYVFDPLGMTDTGFCPTRRENVAKTEFDEASGALLCGVVHDENARSFGGVSGNAGLFSTAGDMAKYAKMLLLGGSFGGARILSRRSIEVMRKNRTPHLNLGRSIGWQVNSPASFERVISISAGDLMSETAFGHTGFTGTSMWIDGENDFFAVLMTNRVCPNRENTMIFEMRRAFHNAIAAE
jgi:CubicO group peptidase (beta-lactamase class C family)